MDIAIVIASMGPGGAQRVVAHLAGELGDRGHAVSVVTFSDEADFFPIPSEIDRIRLDVPPASGGIVQRSGAQLGRLRRLRSTLSALEPDVVVSFIHRTNVLALLARWGLDIPLVVSERNYPGHHRIPRSWSALRRLTYPLAAALVVQTEGIRRWFADRIPRVDQVVIPNPVDVPAGCSQERPRDSGDGTREGKRRVLGIGRLVPQKGFDRLLDAFATCAESRPGWRLEILGGGPERGNLERRARRLGVAERVTFRGWVDDVGPELASADVFCLSSRFEGFPNVLLEAMACGVPSVSYDCPTGPAEVIDHGENGLLVQDETPRALADALAEVMDNPKERERLGRAATGVAEAFHLDRIVDRWETLFRRVAGHDGSSGR